MRHGSAGNHRARKAVSGNDTWINPDRYSAVDIAVLGVMRYFFLSFVHPESDCRERAFTLGRRHFGDDGSKLTVAVLQAVQAMRVRRRSMFSFSNPNCPCCSMRMTDCERHLMEMLRAARLGRLATMRAHSMVLCEGIPDGPFLTAMVSLNAMLREQTASRQD